MGKYNSSIYRVRPLMEVVKNDKSAFSKLLKLVGIPVLDEACCFRYDVAPDGEMQLKPTKKQLKELIKHLTSKNYNGSKITNKNRIDLFSNDEVNLERQRKAKEKAFKCLEDGYDKLTPTSRAWYIFEGYSNPDIFIEGDDYIIICEGKWTEPHITVETTYLKTKNGDRRNQMIRHIQGALNYTNKRVYGFYIVDDNCTYKNDLSKNSFKQQLEDETIKMDEQEKSDIFECYMGFTTWQDIKKVIPSVHFLEQEEID